MKHFHAQNERFVWQRKEGIRGRSLKLKFCSVIINIFCLKLHQCLPWQVDYLMLLSKTKNYWPKVHNPLFSVYSQSVTQQNSCRIPFNYRSHVSCYLWRRTLMGFNVSLVPIQIAHAKMDYFFTFMENTTVHGIRYLAYASKVTIKAYYCEVIVIWLKFFIHRYH